MKTKIILIASVSLACFVFSSSQATEVNEKELFQEAINIAKKFGGSLKPQLKEAITSGGPVHAIDICSTVAPTIASNLTKETGWSVRRVSLKARNNKTAIPDSWEIEVLKKFDERQAAGESAETMVYSELIKGQFRFMKAQGVEPLCLTCHAGKVTVPVEAALKEKYPNDMARGYSLGQIRGAFSLTKDL